MDVGEKRIGMALSGPDFLLNQGLKRRATASGAKDNAEIESIAREFEVSRIVVGFPTSLDRSIGPKAQTIIRFDGDIGHFADIPVDPRVFDTASIRQGTRKGSIDTMAAQIILQGHMDAKEHA